MIRELVTLPVKLPVALARFGAGLARDALDELFGLLPGRPADAPPPPARPREDTRAPAEPEPRGEGRMVEGVRVRAEPDIESGPHDEVDELFDQDPTPAEAREFRRELHEAEYGEEGGAEVRVEPPWEGYDKMTAAQVVQRLRDADATKLAMVRLYEKNNRARKTVLAATDDTVAGRASSNGG